jgi:exopolyphosphatase/guanosine-5'-triphosphate,3'-diphosphate pyrophosphatase
MFAEAPIAIIDIGSNSVRLVVYSGAKRIPSVIFNEKIMAGLGREVAETGRLGAEARERALAALCRFHLLIRDMGVVRTRVVATAAVRDASNGEEFLDAVRRIGFDPTLVSGREEGRLAGLGVISAIPDADGIVGDLGGGSLELVEVADGESGRSVSLPLGVLRLDGEEKREVFAERVRKAVAEAGFAGAAEGRRFYMVGGSWRAVAGLDMALGRHPLPITHQHCLAPNRPRALRAELRKADRDALRHVAVSSGRIASLPVALRLLDALVDVLTPESLVVSSFGIREGLLYDDLEPEEKALDPLIAAAREAGAGLGRFAQHGGLLDAWIAPAFDDAPPAARLRLAACLLADIGWAAHPDFRAERGIDMALHGNWVAVDAPGRVMLAQALFSSFGGGRSLPYPDVAALCTPEQLERASQWGYAMRVGQRLSGGVAAGLERSRLSRGEGTLRLELGQEDSALLGETVERRLKTLAGALGLRPETRMRDDRGKRSYG